MTQSIRSLRIAAGLTQKDCAARYGASQPTWSRMEARASTVGVRSFGPWLWALLMGCVRREAAERGHVIPMDLEEYL